MKHLKANNMTNLLERLKPEFLKIISDQEVKYPFSTNQVQIELSETNHWIDLKYSTVFYLCNTLRIYDYSPSAIEKLFRDEEH
jgi:hypothetical protein